MNQSSTQGLETATLMPLAIAFSTAGDQVRVLIDVDDAPVLVTGAAAPAPGLLGFVALLLDCTVDDRHRSPEAVRDDHQHSVAVGSVPMGEVVRLRLLAFGEDGDPPGRATG